MEEISALDMFRTPKEANLLYLTTFDTDQIVTATYHNGRLSVLSRVPASTSAVQDI